MDDWRDSAACRGMDTELFFSAAPSSRRRALATCRTCPVAAECLQAALDVERAAWAGAFHGIYGALTARSRHRLARNLNRRTAR